jgi:hypothetical protein
MGVCMNAFDAIIASAAQYSLGQFDHLLSSVSLSVVAAVLAIPVILAAISRRWLSVISTLLLAGAVLIAIVHPAAAGALVAVGGCITSFIVAFSALHARRRDRAMQADLQLLRADVDRLVGMEQRRMIVELRSATRAPDVTGMAAE